MPAGKVTVVPDVIVCCKVNPYGALLFANAPPPAPIGKPVNNGLIYFPSFLIEQQNTTVATFSRSRRTIDSATTTTTA
jgi:hypothetical protein